jgi:DNA invertase Pin-like site-specific DNA recombinase
MSEMMTKKQFVIFLKTLDIKQCEFAKKYGLNKHTVYKFTRQVRKIAESVAKSKKYNWG